MRVPIKNVSTITIPVRDSTDRTVEAAQCEPSHKLRNYKIYSGRLVVLRLVSRNLKLRPKVELVHLRGIASKTLAKSNTDQKTNRNILRHQDASHRSDRA